MPKGLVRNACFALLGLGCAGGFAGLWRPEPLPEIVSIRPLFKDDGGRLDWCAASNRIAYDSTSSSTRSEVYSVDPDGGDKRCITCETPGLPKGLRGNPSWHPSCEYLVIQVNGAHYKRNRYEFLSYGIHHDLWLVAADGSWAERIVEVDSGGAAHAPSFDETGERLFWSVRERTGRRVRQNLFRRTPVRENPWDGWHLAIASFERPPGGPARLSNREDLFDGDGSFYRAEAIRGDTIWFSHTRKRVGYIDSIEKARADGSRRSVVEPRDRVWEEGVRLSPGGRLLTFISSREMWRLGQRDVGTLTTELWASTRDDQRVRLTGFNAQTGSQSLVVVTDHAWGPSGREIAVFSRVLRPDGRFRRKRIDILGLSGAF